MKVAGVDGCRGGWVGVLHDGRTLDAIVFASFASLLDELEPETDVMGVDIPIGLPSAGTRTCDVAARRHLGPRRSSVFPAPPRPLLGVRDYTRALAVKRRVDGVGLSKQAFHLLPKIAEVDRAMDPCRQERIVESHPELAFARLHGRALATPKRTPEGTRQRRALLEAALGGVPPTPRGAAAHDVMDAAVLVCTAQRLARRAAERLGDGERDARGLVMEIAW